MYRTIFTPSYQNSNIPIVIPSEWYGQKIEVIAFPVYGNEQAMQALSVQERRREREELLNRYPLDLSNFKFNRDEANDYD
jgi:hypothetical protein